jgi:hypothetical protein
VTTGDQTDPEILLPLEIVQRRLQHGVGQHEFIRAGAGPWRDDDICYELSKEGVVRQLPLSEALAGGGGRHCRHVAAADLPAAHARIRETLGQQYRYGLFGRWTCDAWTRYVETGEKRWSPQVVGALRGLGTVGGLVVGVLLTRRLRR